MTELVTGTESFLTDDDIIRFTQGTRKRLIDSMLAKGIPEDTKDQLTLLTALADADRTALGNKRIGANEKQAAADALVARALAQLSVAVGSENPFSKASGVAKIPTVDVAKLPSANAVPGEMDIGLSEDNYKSLMEKFD